MITYNYFPMTIAHKLYLLILKILITYVRFLLFVAGIVWMFMKALISFIMPGLSYIFFVISPIVAPLLSAYIAFVNSLNYIFGTFLQSCLVRVPWLAKGLQLAIKFLAPTRFIPALKILQGICILAAVPYIAAFVVGAFMFLYTFAVRLIINGAQLICSYLSFKNTNKSSGTFVSLKNVYNKIDDLYHDRYNFFERRIYHSPVIKFFLILFHCVPLLMLVPFDIVVAFGIACGHCIANAFCDARRATEDAVNATLNIFLFKIMRRSLTTVANVPTANNSPLVLEAEEDNCSQSEEEINMDYILMLNDFLKADREKHTTAQFDLTPSRTASNFSKPHCYAKNLPDNFYAI